MHYAAQHGAGVDAASGPKIAAILKAGIGPNVFPFYQWRRSSAATRWTATLSVSTTVTFSNHLFVCFDIMFCVLASSG